MIHQLRASLHRQAGGWQHRLQRGRVSYEMRTQTLIAGGEMLAASRMLVWDTNVECDAGGVSPHLPVRPSSRPAADEP